MQFLVIEGNIGAGKTTLAKMLAEETNAKLVLEQFADNPFLPKFYKNPDRYSFPLELSFLADRYNQVKKEILNLDLFHPMLIADYHFSKTSIFAQNTLKDDEYRLFRQIFDIVSETIPKPDLYVYLHNDVNNLKKNIKKRGREYEQDIENEYLEKIKTGYFSYFRKINNFPILIIELKGIDFVKNSDHFNFIKNAVLNEKYIPGINRILWE